MDDNITLNPEGVERRQSLAPVSAKVYPALEHGNALAQDFFSQPGRRHDPWLFAFLVRYGLGQALPQEIGEVEDYGFTLNAMCGIRLRADGSTIRIWKKPNAEGEFLQPPGESELRQQFYWQQSYFPGTQPPQAHNLAYVWEPRPSGGVRLFLVKPTGYEDIWKPGLFAWVVPIPHPADAIAAHTDFAAVDGDDDLDLELQQTGSDSGDDDPDSGA